MPLNPQDIVRKEFREAFRGYHQSDVDLFLDEVVDELTRLVDENQKMRVRIAALQQELARYRDARSVRANEQMASRYGADDVTATTQERTSRRALPNMPKPEDPFGPVGPGASAPPESSPQARPPAPAREQPLAREPARPSDPASTQPHRPAPPDDRWKPPAGSDRPFWGGD